MSKPTPLDAHPQKKKLPTQTRYTHAISLYTATLTPRVPFESRGPARSLTIHMKAAAGSLDVVKPSASRKADAIEGDVYHGYPLHIIAPRFLAALADACSCTGASAVSRQLADLSSSSSSSSSSN